MVMIVVMVTGFSLGVVYMGMTVVVSAMCMVMAMVMMAKTCHAYQIDC
jgi:hypothetical protein